MSTRSPVGLAVVGSINIIITYGLARFVFGLFLPYMRADMGFSHATAGVIGALPYVSYIGAVLAAPWLTGRMGVRRAGVVTAAFALGGLAMTAAAPGPVVLAGAVLVCGISTGLATPVMVAAVSVAVRSGLRGRINASVNASTSVGIAVATPVLLVLGEAWRPAYWIFAGVAVVGVVVMQVSLPRPAPQPADGSAGAIDPARRRRMARLAALSGTMGAASALYWVFAPDFAVGGGLTPAQSSWMWLALGAGGLAGGAAGDLIDRFGRRRTHAAALALMAASFAALAVAPGSILPVMASAAVFGAAYMLLSGLYLVAGTRILDQRPEKGPVLPFVAISSGQALGSLAAGGMIESLGSPATFGAFAAITAGVAALSLSRAAWR